VPNYKKPLKNTAYKTFVVLKSVISHLNEITVELPAFDEHNEKHSERVLDNMAKILGNKLDDFNVVELFFFMEKKHSL